MRCRSLIAFIGVWAFVIPAHAQVTEGYVLEDNAWNTGAGLQALGNELGYETATGACQTATGTTYACGFDNTAVGQQAALNNETGSGNTAVGTLALVANYIGNSNTAIGYYALGANTASANTATGTEALYKNTTGGYNSASGYETLYSNTGGNYNNASGYLALHDNTTGSQNNASGVQALFGNKTGNFNTASGTDALYANTTGSANIAEGYKAGYNLTTGGNNIDIGNMGVAGESGTIRIGTNSTQTATYIAGIYGVSVTGNAVVVSSAGQLGVTVSSERFKTDIAPMGSDTAKLDQLRPVSFKLKSDVTGTRQFGLIAEEVAKVYPELVIRDEVGRIDGVRYDELAPMLLNEIQKRDAAQAEKNASQEERIALQELKITKLMGQLAEMHAALVKLQRTDEVVAQR
jgi:hypothetical protein